MGGELTLSPKDPESKTKILVFEERVDPVIISEFTKAAGLNPETDVVMIHDEASLILTRTDAADGLCSGAKYRVDVDGKKHEEAVYISMLTRATVYSPGQYRTDGNRLGSGCIARPNVVEEFRIALGFRAASPTSLSAEKPRLDIRNEMINDIAHELQKGGRLSEELRSLGVVLPENLDDLAVARGMAEGFVDAYIRYEVDNDGELWIRLAQNLIALRWYMRKSFLEGYDGWSEPRRLRFNTDKAGILSTVRDAYSTCPPFGQLLITYYMLEKSLLDDPEKK